MPQADVLARQVDRYVLLRECGRGSTGIVHAALDTWCGRVVALKLARAELGIRGQALLRGEASALARIAHPNVLPLLDARTCRAGFFLTLPLVEGKPLSDCIPPEGWSDTRKAVELVARLASTLDYLWRRHGLLHHDLKPANILLIEGISFYLLDFEHARFSDSPRENREHGPTGSPAYMAPEIIQGHPSKNAPTSDLYSLGVLLYLLLTGSLPFPVPYPQVLAHILTRTPAPPSTRRMELPTSLDAIVMRLLARQPDHRFPSGADVARALTDWLEH